MVISRRVLLGSLGAGVLTVGSGCRGRRGTRRPTTTAPTADPLTEPDQALVLGSIGASHGRTAAFEKAIAIAVEQAMIDINAQYKGLFGQKVTMSPRHVMADPSEDVVEAATALADQGVSAVISSLDEDALLAAMPTFIERGVAVIDVITSGMSLREEVDTAGLLLRLCPNDAVNAARLFEESRSGGSSDRAGIPGTIAYLSEDTAQGRSLHDQLLTVMGPEGGEIVHTHFYPLGKMGDVTPIVAKVVETHPARVVINGGPEAGPFLSALYTATLDEGKRPTLEIPASLSPAATVDYASAGLAAECMTSASGWEPGGELTVQHENMMINVDPGFVTSGYAYSQHGYDAVVLACLAAQDALSTAGSDIAASLPKVLNGGFECTDFDMCRRHLRDALDKDERATVTYQGRMGPVEIGGQGDPVAGAMRTFSWGPAGELIPGNASNFDDKE